jgi:hypothetical protein
MKKFIILAPLLFLAGHAKADDDGERKVIYKSTTQIDFEDLEIEGILVKPQSALVLERKKASFNPLIKLRTDWNDEIEKNVDEVK